MKKAYSKPEIAFECFQMSSNIATCSGLIANSGSEATCEVFENGVSVFSAENQNCFLYECYDVPTKTLEVFGS